MWRGKRDADDGECGNCGVEYLQRRRGLKQLREAESCIFPTDSFKFPTDDIMDAQYFNFSPKFTQNSEF